MLLHVALTVVAAPVRIDKNVWKEFIKIVSRYEC
jgi:hypothetical protein